MMNNELGPPCWGFLLVVATVTQADGLGWHRAATLWRKTEDDPAYRAGVPALCMGLLTPHLDDRRSPTIRGDLRSSEAAGSGDPRRARRADAQRLTSGERASRRRNSARTQFGERLLEKSFDGVMWHEPP